MKKILLIPLFTLLLFSCTNDSNEEDIVKDVPKDGAIESDIKVEHLNDSLDILITQYKIWKNGISIKNGATSDTIPSLGFKDVYDENNNKKQLRETMTFSFL
ncbi:MAG: hypothetical protein IPP48_06410 [Chitinophagaceae bacterium]|nr:hypothetical protein [Chitinophagaceae bacterium]